MNYAKLYQEYITKPNVKSLTTQIVRFSIPGQTLVGKIIDIQPFEHSLNDTQCNRYIMDTANGQKSFVLGERLDKELSGVDLIGRVLAVQYNGKVDLDKGRSVNLFDINDLTDVDISKLLEAEKEVINGKLDEKAGEANTTESDKNP